jgi:hypothetical protein
MLPPSGKIADFIFRACQPSGNRRGCGGIKILARSVLKPNLE